MHRGANVNFANGGPNKAERSLTYLCLYVFMYKVLYYKYKKHFIKILKDVGMVVPKIKETGL